MTPRGLDRPPPTQVLEHVGVGLAPPILDRWELWALRGCRPPAALTVGQEARQLEVVVAAIGGAVQEGLVAGEPQRRSLTPLHQTIESQNEDSAGFPWYLTPRDLQKRLYGRTARTKRAL